MKTAGCKVIFMFLVALLVSSTGSKPSQQFYRLCMKNGNRQDWFESLPKKDAKQCMRFLRLQGGGPVSSYGDVRTNSVITPNAQSSRLQARKVALQYFQGLNMWKNGEKNLGSSILDHISPCWKQFEEEEEKWKAMFEKRQDNEVKMIKITEQTWVGEEGNAVITPPTNPFGHSGRELIAAELLLHRESPWAIGESYGRYRSIVYAMQGNDTEKRIHADFQTSCSTKHGNMIALDVDVDHIAEWLDDRAKSLQVQIRVQPRRQYFTNRRNEERRRVDVVKQLVGLVLHFTPSTEEISSHLVKAYTEQRSISNRPNENNDRAPALMEMRPTEQRFEHQGIQENNEELATQLINAARSMALSKQQQQTEPTSTNESGSQRRRRSVDRKRRRSKQRRGVILSSTRPPITLSPQTTRHCHRSSHRMSYDMYQRMGIVYPEHGHQMFDIGECVGHCPFPLTSTNLNATNHALVISMALDSNPSFSICCVPVTYKHMFYTKMTEDDNLNQERFKNFIATSCACR